MRIGIDARYVYDHFPGIGRYVYNLIAALGTLQTNHQFFVVYNPTLPNSRYDMGALDRFPSVTRVATTARPFRPDEQIRIPLLARALHLDLLHTPYLVRPYFGIPCPTVLTVYDLIGWRFPETLSRNTRWMFSLAMRLALHSSQGFLAISHSARADLFDAYAIAPERVAVTPLAADSDFAPQDSTHLAELRDRYSLPSRYVLYLGSNKPHKNLERLVRAWGRVVQDQCDGSTLGQTPPVLVIAGHYDPRYTALQEHVAELGLEKRVCFLPNIAAADLPALYAAAELFAFPSFYEGFGLPPLEAMACGTPVLCANTSSMPEVVGDAAITVDPFDETAIAAGIGQLLRDPALRADLRTRGLQRSKAFSWERTARKTLAVYEGMAAT